jgi:hypothetical protein
LEAFLSWSKSDIPKLPKFPPKKWPRRQWFWGTHTDSKGDFQMAYFINPVKEDQCLFLTYEGNMPPIEIAAVRYEAIGLLAAKQWNRMVVDITELRSVPTTFELLNFGRSQTWELPPSTRVALVIRPEQVNQANRVQNVARSERVSLAYFFRCGCCHGLG